MRYISLGFVILLISALLLAQQGMMPGPGTPHSAGAGVTWTLRRSAHNTSCPATAACTITGVTTNAGDLLVMCRVGNDASTGTPTIISTASGDGTWTTGVGANASTVNGGSAIFSDCTYRLSATGGTGITLNTTTANNTPGSNDMFFAEYTRSTGTATFDGAAEVTNIYQDPASPCTSCVAGNVTITGSSDVCVVAIGITNSFNGAQPAGSTYVNPNDFENANVEGAMFGALNLATGNGPTIAQDVAGAASISSVCFK